MVPIQVEISSVWKLKSLETNSVCVFVCVAEVRTHVFDANVHLQREMRSSPVSTIVFISRTKLVRR